MNNTTSRIVQLTTVHKRTDTRIAVKQCPTLCVEFPGSLTLVVADGDGNDSSQGFEISDLGPLREKRLARLVIGFFRSLSVIRSNRPTILHFHDPELIPFGLVAKAFGVTVIYDVHEDVPKQILQKEWIPRLLRRFVAAVVKRAEALAASAFDGIVAATPKIAEKFPAQKTALVQNFPLRADVGDVAEVAYPERPNNFVYVGALSTLRGASEMLQSVEMVDRSLNPALDIAGSFSPASLEQELLDGVDNGRVRFHGWTNRSETKRLLDTARAGLVLFHPAPNHNDAQPNKLFEYMAAGLPVIASDFPLWRTIVDGVGCGLLVDPKDPVAISNAMQWLLTHPQEAERMGAAGRSAALERFNWTPEGEKLIGLYRRLLSCNSHGKKSSPSEKN